MSDKNNTVQSKMSQLEELVGWFQGEEFVLEESVQKFEQAEKLAAEIEEDLLKIKNDIKIVKERFDS